MNSVAKTAITNKRVLLRTDYNVSLTPTHTVADDKRIRETLPTIKNLLSGNNKIIILSHLGRPEKRDPTFSLEPVRNKLASYLSGFKITLVPTIEELEKKAKTQTPREILLLENIRFYKQEQENDTNFAQRLAKLGDAYVNDAYSVNHRKDASIVGIPKFLQAYAGLLLSKEVEAITKILDNPARPLVSITGGNKISTKFLFLHKTILLSDIVLVGGGLANTLLMAKGINIGKSICEEAFRKEAEEILQEGIGKLYLPLDVRVAKNKTDQNMLVVPVEEIPKEMVILDIGPITEILFSEKIKSGKTIIWNGPVGYFENKTFIKGTNSVCRAITSNKAATSIIGGGDTIASVEGCPDLENITHISTGGGALLEFIEKGNLPGIEAILKSGS